MLRLRKQGEVEIVGSLGECGAGRPTTRGRLGALIDQERC